MPVAQGHTGRPWDADAAAYNVRARWYDPAVGRWLSEDPSGFAAGDANLYRYCGNSPLTNIDPTGLCHTGMLHGAFPTGSPLDFRWADDVPLLNADALYDLPTIPTTPSLSLDISPSTPMTTSDWWGMALGLPTFFSLGGEVAVEHALQFRPASPENEPTGTMVALAILVSAKSG